ncbi:MAG: PASTA domain-containing protein [Oscillospiraceae bacterium]|jgi:stage V sporulation protein D (sporulation-specific penicillin-binding protein)|nr:PASTA domain-containing protein [Oscillospiraceae bacterium]
MGPSLKMKKRLKYAVLVAVIASFSVVMCNLVNISVFQYGFYTAKANSNQYRPETIPATRGSIYDRNMQTLASSKTAFDVNLSPRDIGEKDKLAIVKGLAAILEMDETTILDKIDQNANKLYVNIKNRIEEETEIKIRDFIVENGYTDEIYLTENTKRVYPNSTLAASVIGFTGTDGGLYGLELKYDSILSGTPGYTVSLKDARGENMPDTNEERYDPVNGSSLVLTIDETIQHFVEKTLTKVMAQHNPNEGCAAIVMDVNTFEILAMANMPTFDLNDPYTIYDPELAALVDAAASDEERLQALRDARGAQWSNKCISYNYEPGSTFKLITASAALEEGTSSLNSTFHCGGVIKVADRDMKCHIYPRAHGTEDFTHAVVDSCNPSFVQIGANLGSARFYKYFESFGLTEKTGIDLPGEGRSLYKTEADLKSTVALASCSFGQSNSITPIQLITAVSAVVNGGYLGTPHVVKDVLDDKGNVIQSVQPEVRHQVISSETSAVMRTIMETVVTEKPTTNAYVAGYRIGGKSGTAQKLFKSEKNLYVASYIAVAPIDDPQIAVLCLVDEPTAEGQYYGSVVAMPPAAAILADTLPYLGISPKYTAEELEIQNVTMPLLLNMSELDAETKLSSVGLGKPEIIGEGDTIVRQVPSVGSSIPKDGKVYIYMDSSESRSLTVPDVRGMRPSAAISRLKGMGFNVIVEGATANDESSQITLQDLPVGDSVPVGTVITLTSVEFYSD